MAINLKFYLIKGTGLLLLTAFPFSLWIASQRDSETKYINKIGFNLITLNITCITVSTESSVSMGSDGLKLGVNY